MSCFYISHTSKHNQSALKGIGIHNQRSSKNSSNTDIDKSKSEENYDLHNEEEKQIFYEARIKEILEENYKAKVKLRANSVKMVSTVISASPEFFEGKNQEEIKKYFEINYEYLKQKVGEENVISAKVHLDEKTPHMHFCSVPLTKDGRLSAKELYDRNSLRNLQSEPVKILQKTFPEITRGKENHTGKSLHVSTTDLKKLDAQKRFEELEKSKKNLSQIDALVNKITQNRKDSFKDSIVGAFKEIDNQYLVRRSDLNFLLANSRKVVELEQINEKLIEEKNYYEKSNERLGDEKRDLVTENYRIRNNEIAKIREALKKEKSLKEEIRQLTHITKTYSERLENQGIDTSVKKLAPIKEKTKNRGRNDFER